MNPTKDNEDVYWAVDDAVYTSLFRSVKDAVDQDVFWRIVDETIYRSVYMTVYDAMERGQM